MRAKELKSDDYVTQVKYINFYRMNQIDLFQNQSKKQATLTAENHKEKRPPHISVSKVFSDNQKWKQCKIIGKNISIRSYSAACSFNSKYFRCDLGSTSMEGIKF